jgi:adenylate cyclase, class 2
MPIGFEANVLDMDPDEVAVQVLRLGGCRVGEQIMRRYVYDIDAGDGARWVRLRDSGAEVTFTVKEVAHDGIDGTTETEVIVGDFETTNEMFGRMGFLPKSYQRTCGPASSYVVLSWRSIGGH